MHVALLRGINVGGGRKVPMAELRSVAEGLGLKRVRTLIASGNLVSKGTRRSRSLKRPWNATSASRSTS
jgi:uncharacterized protein (DUF1697 family)